MKSILPTTKIRHRLLEANHRNNFYRIAHQTMKKNYDLLGFSSEYFVRMCFVKCVLLSRNILQWP